MLILAIILSTFVPTTVRWLSEPSQIPVGKGIAALPGGNWVGIKHERADGKARLVCMQSDNEGKTWLRLGTVAEDPDPQTDIGDGNLLVRRNGTLVCAYRQNHRQVPDYAIRIAESKDQGRTWRPMPTVFESKPTGAGPSRGLWAPFVFETAGGELQCYYDDEKTPFDEGYRGHQWLQMRRFNKQKKGWEEPITVSRAHDPKHLSRDGMATVVELSNGRLLCAYESVQTYAPHAGVIRYVTSDDGGKTWNWVKREREVLFQPAKKDFMALAPCLARLDKQTLACIFVTDEDRETPDKAGTPAHLLHMDAKMVFSTDNGKTWDSQTTTVYDGSHRTYLPWLTPLGNGRFIAGWLSFEKGMMVQIGKAIR